MRLSGCHNIDELRRLAKARLPWPVFDYIDGAADDEVTKARNTAAFDDVIEHRPGQARLRQSPQVVDVVATGQTHDSALPATCG